MNTKKIEELNKSYLKIKVTFDSIFSELLRYYNSASDMLKAEAINKTRRYGRNEYKKKFLLDPSGIISSHMKAYLYNKAMEEQLLLRYKLLGKEMNKIEKQLKKLKENKKDE
jgi:hypothetical protein